jgi:hypothetical protein
LPNLSEQDGILFYSHRFDAQRVIDSSLTTGEKLFLIDVIETYLPTATLTDAGAEIIEALMELDNLRPQPPTSSGNQE